MVVCVFLTKKEAGNVNMLLESPKQPYTGITDSTGNEFHIPPLKKGLRNAKTKKLTFWLSMLALSKVWLYFPADAKQEC